MQASESRIAAPKALISDGRAIVRARVAEWSAKLAGKRALHFIHVGKTGGSAVMHVLGEWTNKKRYEIFEFLRKTGY